VPATTLVATRALAHAEGSVPDVVRQAHLRGRGDESHSSPAGVHAAGFDVARPGEVALRAASDRSARAATGHPDEPPKAFGAALYNGVRVDYAADAGFACYATILRACIIDHWPVGAGKQLFGQPGAQRRLHSSVAASKDAVGGVDVIRHFFVEPESFPKKMRFQLRAGFSMQGRQRAAEPGFHGLIASKEREKTARQG